MCLSHIINCHTLSRGTGSHNKSYHSSKKSQNVRCKMNELLSYFSTTHMLCDLMRIATTYAFSDEIRKNHNLDPSKHWLIWSSSIPCNPQSLLVIETENRCELAATPHSFLRTIITIFQKKLSPFQDSACNNSRGFFAKWYQDIADV